VRRTFTRLAVAAFVTTMAACAGKAPVPTVTTPHYQDFVFPAVPPSLQADRSAAERHERGWRFLQANDLRNADREFQAALKRNAAYFPADAGLGYVSLAQKDYKTALARFELALRQSAAYPSALFGQGDALLGLGRPLDALKSFQAALAADPSLAVAAARVQVLRLRTLQEEITRARQAADLGRYDEARQAYQRAITASPESAFLYRDLGAVERKQGDTRAALEAFRKAASLDPTDARPLVQIGELLEAQGDFDGAAQAYTQAAAIEPGQAATARVEQARQRAAIARMPPEFADIAKTPRLARGDLAALIGVHFTRLLDTRASRDTVLVTDTRQSWAAPWIARVVDAGIMDVNANHTFQPRNPVRRLDLARAISNLLDLAAATRPPLAALLQSAATTRPVIGDVPASHLSYAAVAQVVAAGVMPLLEDGTFRPSQVVSGEEALQVIDRVETVVGRGA
jgi:tetratricopeptide (TPR) repeat protein